MAIRMGRWDCVSCGHKGNLGSQTHCAHCGAPRSPAVEFYLPDEEPEVTNPDQISEALSGADWKCNYCGSENKATATHCKSCGNVYDHEDTSRKEKIIYDQPPSEIPEKQPEQFSQESSEKLPQKRSKRRFVIIGTLLFLVFSVWWCFHTSTSTMTIEKHHWCFSQQVQAYKPVTESSFSIPPGGRLLSQTTKVYRYDQVPDGKVQKTRQVRVQTGSRRVKSGTRNKGNGYFQDVYRNEPIYSYRTETYYETKYRSVPVYKPYYTYEIYKWINARPRDTLQGYDLAPRFPDPKLPDSTNWKIIDAKTYFAVLVKDAAGNNHQIEVTEKQFYRINDNEKQVVSQNNIGVMWIDDEKQQPDKPPSH